MSPPDWYVVVCLSLLSGRNGAMTQGFRPLTCSFPAYDGIYDDCAWLMERHRHTAIACLPTIPASSPLGDTETLNNSTTGDITTIIVLTHT